MVIEEFSELKELELVLRKFGFDVVGISSEFAMAEKILSFNPDFVIADGQGSKVSSVGVGRRLREMPRWNGHTILGFPPGYKPTGDELLRIRMDGACEAPITPEGILPFLAKLHSENEYEWIARLKEVRAHMKDEAARESAAADSDRRGVFVPGDTPAEESPFAAPDFNAIEAELKSLAGEKQPAQPVAKKMTPLVESEEVSTSVEKTPDFWVTSIARANEEAKARLMKARESLKGVRLQKESTLTRKKTHQVQRDLALDWKSEDLKAQDVSRREFTRFLFKKK